MTVPAWDDRAEWSGWQDRWDLRPDTIYLNHGSFGPPPRVVCAAQRAWRERLDCQPMDFFVRQQEPALLAARARLAAFVGTGENNLVFVENATAGMNVLAASFPLARDDEVVLTNHEYGAVMRIWARACRRAGTKPPVMARLPERIESVEQVVDAVFAPVTDRTRMMVVSHITSPTALILPVAAICRRARERGIAVAVDGPHAPAQIPLKLAQLGCDFYTASCHKWLCAPSGSGFLAVADPDRYPLAPLTLSWGRLPPAEPHAWWEEFMWSGTRDPSAYLATTAAIEFLEEVGLDQFRARSHALAQHARTRLTELTGLEPPLPDSAEWYGSMALAVLPPGDSRALQDSLWRGFGIEVPIIDFEQHRFIRVSCHLYNTPDQVETLIEALRQLGL